MKNKNGFTLVELLAVIAILAILVIIALPNVMGMFNSAKKSSFMTEVKQIYKVAQQEWINDSMFNTSTKEYGRCNGCSYKELGLSGRKEIKYYIKIDKAGTVLKYKVNDGTYEYYYSGNGLNIEEISLEDVVAASSDDLQVKQYVYTNSTIGTSTTVSRLSRKYNTYQEVVNATGEGIFLRCEVEGDTIVTVDLGFVHNSQAYYLNSDSPSAYEINKDYLSNTLHLNCNQVGEEFRCGTSSATVCVKGQSAFANTGDYVCGIWGPSKTFYCRVD